MPRIKLIEQKKYEFVYNIQVRITDMNSAGHIGNSQIAEIMQEASFQLYRTLGLSIADIGDDTGTVMADLVVNFKAEAYAGDILSVGCHIGDIDKKSFRIFYILQRDNNIIALAETGILPFDYTHHSRPLLPEKFINAVKEYQSQIPIK
jgi:acyl-CoA thioesterase FadM